MRIYASKIKEFAHENLQINLAISLHAPNNELRTSLMRITRNAPLEKLFEAIDYYTETTNRRVTYEYIMLSGEMTALKSRNSWQI